MKAIKLIALFLVMTLSATTSYGQQEKKADLAKQKNMPAYIMAFVRIHDFEAYQKEYLEKAGPIVVRHGGKALAVSQNPQIMEGTLPEGRLVIVEFPSIENAKAFYNDPEYKPLIKVREKMTESDAIMFERGF